MTKDDEARYLVTDGRDGSNPFVPHRPLFAALLQQRGLTTLHAGAVEAESGAMLFAGLKGAGKSTLLGALVERGYALLSDDVTGVEAADGRFVALPASTCVRLRADSLETLRRRRTLEKVHERSDKHLLPAVRLCTGPTTVRAVYVLEPHHRADVEIRQTSWARAHDAAAAHLPKVSGDRRRTFAPSARWWRKRRSFTSDVPLRRSGSLPWRSASRRISSRMPLRTSPPHNAAKGTSLWKSARETAVARRRKVIGDAWPGRPVRAGRGGVAAQACRRPGRRGGAAAPRRPASRLNAALDACRRVAAAGRRPGCVPCWAATCRTPPPPPPPPQAPDAWPAGSTSTSRRGSARQSEDAEQLGGRRPDSRAW